MILLLIYGHLVLLFMNYLLVSVFFMQIVFTR